MIPGRFLSSVISILLLKKLDGIVNAPGYRQSGRGYLQSGGKNH